MHRTALRPARWQRWLLATTGLALLLSGALWLALHDSGGAGTGALPHPAEAGLMRLHGAAAFFALFCAGLMAGHHIPAGWHLSQRPRQGGQRRSGLALCGLFLLTTGTGYLLYYFAPETWRPALGWLHSAADAPMVLAAAWHGRAKSPRRLRHAPP